MQKPNNTDALKTTRCSAVPSCGKTVVVSGAGPRAVGADVLHWCRNPGGRREHAVREPSLLRGIAGLRRSDSRRRPPVAARGGGGAGAMVAGVRFH